MSIAKGFLIISLFLSGFLIFLCKYCYLKHKLTKEREYFINTLNHDIRVSLLAQLRAYEIIEKNNYNYEIVSELLNEVNHSCKYSYEMVNMLLNTYQFENGENVLNYETFNLSNLIYSIISKSSALIKDKKIKLNYNLNNEIMAYADKQALHKVEVHQQFSQESLWALLKCST